MSQIRVDNIISQSGTGAPNFPNGINVTGVVTASVLTTSVGSLTINGTNTIPNGPVIVGSSSSTNTANQPLQVTGGAYVSGNLGIGATNPTNPLQVGSGSNIVFVDSQGDLGIGTAAATSKLHVVGDVSISGFTTVGNTFDLRGAVETVSVGATYDLGGGRVVLECNAQNGTVFTHNLANGTVGIVSLRNFPANKNSVTTFTILFTQSSTAPTAGVGNTTAFTGIGTNVRLTPSGVAGFTTSALVSTGSTVVLSSTANDVDVVTLSILYNGSGATTPGNYRTLVTNNSGFRFGSIGF